MSVKLITDSTADIPSDIARALGIRVVPLYVRFGEEVYRDGVDLSPEDFYRKLVASKTLPTTSTVSAGEFASVYDDVARDTDEILCIVISSELSATYQAALQGRELMETKSCRVEVTDSRLLVMALGLVVIAAAREAQRGTGLDEVMRVAHSAISRVRVRMVFDTLEYARKGGRIGRAQAFLGSLLSLKPVLTVSDGVAVPVARERTRSKAIEHLRRFAVSCGRIEDMAVEYTTTAEEAVALAESLDPVFPRERSHVSCIGAVMGTHLGPGALGVAVLKSVSSNP